MEKKVISVDFEVILREELSNDREAKKRWVNLLDAFGLEWISFSRKGEFFVLGGFYCDCIMKPANVLFWLRERGLFRFVEENGRCYVEELRQVDSRQAKCE